MANLSKTFENYVKPTRLSDRNAMKCPILMGIELDHDLSASSKPEIPYDPIILLVFWVLKMDDQPQ